MELAGYLDVLDADTIRVRGHRIDIVHGLAYYHEGYSAELIALELPTLSLDEVYGVLTYYLHNRTAVDAYLARRAAQAESCRRLPLSNLHRRQLRRCRRCGSA